MSNEAEGKIERIEKMVKDLHLAVIGDESIGVPGVVKTQREHAKEIQGLKQWRWYLSGGVAALAFVISILASKL